MSVTKSNAKAIIAHLESEIKTISDERNNYISNDCGGDDVNARMAKIEKLTTDIEVKWDAIEEIQFKFDLF